MKRTAITTALIFGALMVAQAGLIEEWQLNDAAGTTLNALENSAGIGKWNVADRSDYIKTDGAGNLVLTKSGDGSNLYNAGRDWSFKGANTGKCELTLRYSGVDFSSGVNGSMFGLMLRDLAADNIAGIDITLNSGALKLRATGSVITLLDTFGGTSGTLATNASLQVRSVVDLDSDTMDVFYSIDGGAESEFLDLGIASGATLDHLRFNLKASTMGTTDFVKVDYMSLSQIPEPATLGLVGMAGLVLMLLRRRITG